jgi:Glycosyltransferase family 87
MTVPHRGQTPPIEQRWARIFFVFSMVFGCGPWLMAIPGLIGNKWNISDTGVLRSVWRLVLGGHPEQIFNYSALEQEFLAAGLGGHADLNAWVYPPQHAIAFAPLGFLEPRILYMCILAANIASWWWVLRSLGSFVASVAPEFWSPARVSMMRSAGWLFGPAALSGILGAFTCMIIAATWKVIRDCLLFEADLLVGAESSSSKRSVWTNAVLLFAAMVKPQMILLVVVALFVHSRLGRKIVLRSVGIGIGSLVAIALWTDPTLFTQWADTAKQFSSAKLGTPRSNWWSPIPIVSDVLANRPPSTLVSIVVLTMCVALVGWPFVLRRTKSETNSRMFVSVTLALLLTYAAATYQSMYDTVVVFPAVVLSLTLHAQRSRKMISGNPINPINPIKTVRLAVCAAVAALPLGIVARSLSFLRPREVAMASLLTLCAVGLIGLYHGANKDGSIQSKRSGRN